MEAALDKIEVIFINPSSTELAEAKFESAVREPGESLITWHIRLRELFVRAYPKDKKIEENKRLKDRFVLKCRDRALTVALKNKDNYRSYTYTETLTKAQDFEATVTATSQAYEGGKYSHRHIQEMQPEEEEDQPEENHDEHSVNQIISNMTDNAIQQLSAQFHHADPFKLNASKIGSNAKNGCYHCGKEGHMLRNCILFSKAIERIKKNPTQFGLIVSFANQSTRRPAWQGRGRGRGRGGAGGRGGKPNPGRAGGSTSRPTPQIQEIQAPESVVYQDFYDDGPVPSSSENA